MEKMVEMGFTEGFKMSMNNLDNLLAAIAEIIRRKLSMILTTGKLNSVSKKIKNLKIKL